MYDSTTPGAIPLGATLILTYIDGNYVTDAEVARLFPNARRVPTTTTSNGNLAAQIYDCERGDGNATEAAAWAKEKIAIDQRPTIYCSRVGEPNYGWSWVQSALELIKVPMSAVDFGIADYTGVQHLVPGSAFTQYVDPPQSGGNYDISVTNGVWPNTPPVPPITTVGTYITENGMIVVTESTTDGNRHVFVYNDTTHTVTHWYQNIKGQPSFAWTREDLPGLAD